MSTASFFSPSRALRKVIALLTTVVQEIFFRVFLGWDTGPAEILYGNNDASGVWMLSETTSTEASISHVT